MGLEAKLTSLQNDKQRDEAARNSINDTFARASQLMATKICEYCVDELDKYAKTLRQNVIADHSTKWTAIEHSFASIDTNMAKLAKASPNPAQWATMEEGMSAIHATCDAIFTALRDKDANASNVCHQAFAEVQSETQTRIAAHAHATQIAKSKGLQAEREHTESLIRPLLEAAARANDKADQRSEDIAQMHTDLRNFMHEHGAHRPEMAEVQSPEQDHMHDDDQRHHSRTSASRSSSRPSRSRSRSRSHSRSRSRNRSYSRSRSGSAASSPVRHMSDNGEAAHNPGLSRDPGDAVEIGRAHV